MGRASPTSYPFAMKGKLRLMLLLTGAAAFAAGAKLARTSDNDNGVRIAPSAAVPPINPSQTIPPISPSRTPSGAGAPPPAASAFRLDDRQLSQAVASAISRGLPSMNGGPAFGDLPISVEGLRVTARDGKVVLRGVVESESDRIAAGARAAAVAGGANVANELTIR